MRAFCHGINQVQSIVVVVNRFIWRTFNREQVKPQKPINTFLTYFWPKNKKMPNSFTNLNHLYKTFSIYFWPKNKKTKSLAHFLHDLKTNSKPLFP